MACELYCCLLPQCEALRICRSGFPIATVSAFTTKVDLRGLVQAYELMKEALVARMHT